MPYNNIMYQCLRLQPFIDEILLAEEASALGERVLEGSSGAPSFVTDLFNDFKLDLVQELGV